jgi:hypothetical protein
MSSPKEKAIELVNKFSTVGLQQREEGIACALIAVDEILENFGTLTEGKDHYCAYLTTEYYEEVKQEILTYGGNK